MQKSFHTQNIPEFIGYMIATIITCIVLGNNALNNWIGKSFTKLTEAVLRPKTGRSYVIGTGILFLFVCLLSARPIKDFAVDAQQDSLISNSQELTTEDEAGKYILSVEQEDMMEDSIVLSYVGDLILLKDQVTTAYNEQTGEYDFNKMFEYAAPYLSEADLSLAVFEGPLAGAEVGYSTSNYGDGLPLYLNFPDEFAQAAREAGIDLVTTANNHLLDMGVEGAMRTLDVLDEMGLAHTGSYRNQEEKDELLIVEVEGVKIAVLSYLKGVNYYKPQEIVEDMPYLTSIMPLTSNEYYDELVKEIETDFEQAKQSDADLIQYH